MEHTDPKHCQEYHFPKRLLVPITKEIRRANSRIKAEFHRTGRVERHSKVAKIQQRRTAASKKAV